MDVKSLKRVELYSIVTKEYGINWKAARKMSKEELVELLEKLSQTKVSNTVKKKRRKQAKIAFEQKAKKLKLVDFHFLIPEILKDNLKDLTKKKGMNNFGELIQDMYKAYLKHGYNKRPLE